ncbi:MAG: AzlD domain-containing protein [Siculibacillus sp.]
MTSLSFTSLDTWWWPWVFILVGGWLANDSWRFLGVAFSGRLTETSPVFAVVKAVATALVAGVIAQLVLYPSGELAQTSVLLRVGAVAIGFAVFKATRDHVFLGVLAGEAAFLIGWWAGV